MRPRDLAIARLDCGSELARANGTAAGHPFQFMATRTSRSFRAAVPQDDDDDDSLGMCCEHIGAIRPLLARADVERLVRGYSDAYLWVIRRRESDLPRLVDTLGAPPVLSLEVGYANDYLVQASGHLGSWSLEFRAKHGVWSVAVATDPACDSLDVGRGPSVEVTTGHAIAFVQPWRPQLHDRDWICGTIERCMLAVRFIIAVVDGDSDVLKA